MPETADEVLGKDAGESKDKGAKKPAAEYGPGVLCANEVFPDDDVLTLDDDEINAIKALNRKIAMRDMPSRREQLVRVWEERLFDRGFQHLLPRQNGGWNLPTIGSGYGPGEDEDRSQWEIDIYSSYRKIICAALTREVPTSVMDPSDPDDDRDITAARGADSLQVKIIRDNDMKGVQEARARLLWTDGVAVDFTRYVLDQQAFGFEPPPEGEVPEDEETGEAATELKGPETPDISELSADEKEETPESRPAEKRTPRGHELITCEGALNWKLPIKANSVGKMPWARYSYEQDLATTKAEFPDKADEIKVSRSGSDGGSGGDDLERLARVNVMLGVEDNFVTEDSAIYDVTIQKFFYRPAALMEIEAEEIRSGLLKKCSKGLYITFSGDICVSAVNASMDDHISVTFADAGDGVHRPSLGRPLVAPQKILNNLAELAYLYFVHGVPMTYMDDDMFDVEAIQDQDNVPGGIRPFESPGNGQTVEGVYWFREQPLVFPEQLLTFTQWIMDEVSQLMSGAYPALFGGDTGSNDTGMGIMMQRDQALGRLGLVWRNIKQTTSSIIRQAVQCLAANREGVIKLGGNEKGQVDLSDLKGNFVCYPNTDENIPESWTQKSNRFTLIVADAGTNPLYQQILDSPANLKIVKQMAGFKDLAIPMLDAWEQQLGENAILFEGGPVPNPALVELEQQIADLQSQIGAAIQSAAPALQAGAGTPGLVPAPAQIPPELAEAQAQLGQLTQQAQQIQQTAPLVSSYPIDYECDDHTVHAMTCLGMVNSPRGRAMKNGNEKDQAAFKNLRLHYLEHDAAAKKKAAEAQQDAQVGKPPSFSANVKDLPPGEAAQVMQKGGVQSDPKDFAAQDAAEAIAKHPQALAGAPQQS